MNIANVDIIRVIAHEVVRAGQLDDRPPILSEKLVNIDSKGKSLVSQRLVDTVASGSHCVDVTVDDSSAGSPFDRITKMIDATDDQFIDFSQFLAKALSTAQTAGSIKSGSVIFAQGTCRADNKDCRFLVVIKADSDQALAKRIVGENVHLTYVSDMLLGESQRLVKIAFFIEETQLEESLTTTARKSEDFSA